MAGKYGDFQNPFYVDPSLDLNIGLRGLGSGLQIRRERNEKEAAKEAAELKKKQASAAAIAAYKTNDPDKIAEAILQNPEIGDTLGKLYDKRRSYAKEDYVGELEKMLTQIEKTGKLPIEAEAKAEAYVPAAMGMSGLGGGTPSPVMGPGQKEVGKTDIIKSVVKKNPKAGKQMLEYEFAKNDPKKYKAWKEVYRPEAKATGSSLKKMITERQALLDQGIPAEDPRVKAYDAKLWPDENPSAPSNLKKMIDERAVLLENGVDPNSDEIKGYNNRILGDAAGKIYGPSPLKKFILEREEYIKGGMKPDDPVIKAYDNKISGIDIDIEEMTDDEIDTWGAWVNATGKMPSVGRGKQATKIRARILKSAARQALGGEEVGDPKKTPLEAAMAVVLKQSDTKAIGSAMTQIEKQLGAMGSFINNMERQTNRIEEIAIELDQGGIRIFNVPRRMWRSKIVGHPLQSKYDMYLTEIEAEIGKLAQGSPQSIAELSTRAQEKWDKIHDKSLGANDLISLVRETQHAAKMRIRSVEDELEKVRRKMRDRKWTKTQISDKEAPQIGTLEEFEALPSGSVYINKKTGKKMRKP